MDLFLVILMLVIAVLLIVLITIVMTKDKQSTKLEDVLRDENSRLRTELDKKIGLLENSFITRLESSSANQSKQLNEITKTNNDVMKNLTQMMESRLNVLTENNEKKLEEMRKTVDEKLHKTLETRLSESFKTVSERLEQVYKGLGEMQTIAQGVGDLKKVMSGVKTRGILGELQLSNIIEQILTPAQYDKNISTKPGSRDVVEFAVKLPGKDDNPVYIPVDAKFPMESYHRLLDAYEAGDAENVASASKEIEQVIKKSAKDIRDKYIYPPSTTDFGIMFLPVEGLYAEVVRNTSLFETLQKDYKVLVAGPSTLSALMTSLQMGFKTLAIEKRAADVWNVLATVKTEFMKFSGVLENAQKKINQANDEMDKLVGARTKKIMVQLNKVSGTDDTELLEELNND